MSVSIIIGVTRRPEDGLTGSHMTSFFFSGVSQIFWCQILRRTSRPEGSTPGDRQPHVDHAEVGGGGRGLLLFSDIALLFEVDENEPRPTEHTPQWKQV